MARTGIYQHRLIQDLINVVWFHNRNADGVTLQEEYCKPETGLSPYLIALVNTAVSVSLASHVYLLHSDLLSKIECCLDEWESGDRIKISFSAAMYEAKYRSHCNTLANVAERPGGSNALKKLCIKLMKRAM